MDIPLRIGEETTVMDPATGEPITAL